MSIEKARTRAITIFVVANVIQDVFVLIANLAVAITGWCRAVIETFNFVKYDQAMKYKTITGGDLGEAIGCPGHFTGECEHQEQNDGIARGDEDDL